MTVIRPSLSVRVVTAGDVPGLTRLLQNLISSAPYSSHMDDTVVIDEVMVANPPTLFPTRMLHQLLLGVWRAGTMVGFLHAAAGMDSESLDLPDYQPLGLVRFLALPPDRVLATDVAQALWPRLQEFWQATGVGYVKAFHISTGYPSFQAGAGILPGDWADHVRVFTADGFQLMERYYCMFRVVDHMVEEVAPLADLSLVYRGEQSDRTYQLFYRRTEFVGSARIVYVRVRGAPPIGVAYVVHVQIASQWRRHGIGRWLLRRIINDTTIQGAEQIVLHLPHGQHAAINLLAQHGFQELNYRGYALDKVLTV